MLKLKLQYFDLVMQTGDSLEKSLMLGKTEGRRRKRVSEDEKDGWPHQCNGNEFRQTSGDGKGTARPGMLQSMGLQRVGHDWAIKQLETQVSAEVFGVFRK